MPKSVTLAVRVPQETRHLLEDKVVSEGFGSLTDLLRTVLTGFAHNELKKDSARPTSTSPKIVKAVSQVASSLFAEEPEKVSELCQELKGETRDEIKGPITEPTVNRVNGHHTIAELIAEVKALQSK